MNPRESRFNHRKITGKIGALAGSEPESPTLWPPLLLFWESKRRFPFLRLFPSSFNRLFEPRGEWRKISPNTLDINIQQTKKTHDDRPLWSSKFEPKGKSICRTVHFRRLSTLIWPSNFILMGCPVLQFGPYTLTSDRPLYTRPYYMEAQTYVSFFEIQSMNDLSYLYSFELHKIQKLPSGRLA